MKTTSIHDRALIRLISDAHHKSAVLRGIVDSDAEAELLAEFEGQTNARLLAEQESTQALDRRELVFIRRAQDLKVYGASHINAAFAYTRSTGNRFNRGARGAWYCSYDIFTSAEEVGYHRTRELRYIGIFEDEARCVELLADFIGDFPDLAEATDHPALHPDPEIGYSEGQALADTLRRDGHRGLLYPSVRRPGGRCFVAFEPGIIQNVRPGARWRLIWRGAPQYSLESV